MFAQIAYDRILNSLDHVQCGQLTLRTPDGKTRVFKGVLDGPVTELELKDWSVFTNLLRRGDIGFADDYRQGLWDTTDLPALLEFSLINRAALDRLVLGGTFARVQAMLSYMFKRNTLKGSKRNIHAHYDLGNDFYKLWLDPTMTYSSALFDGDHDDLVTAQYAKYDRIVDQLGAQSGRLLEVGCGWGGFADRATERGDYDFKGITVSSAQHAYASQRVDGRADIVMEDYRHQSGKFDHIVSIEMFEAVGEKFWKTYFSKLGDLLADNGKAVIQTITINDQDFERYRRGGDFIRSFIFPGGMLPSPSRFAQEAQASGLKVDNPHSFGQDYAKTLLMWLHNFDAKKKDVLDLGFDEGFIRLWRFYLAACAAGFKTGRTDVMQIEVSHA